MVQLLAWCLAKTLRTLARTCRYRILCETPETNPADPDCPAHFIFAVWHDAVMPPVSARTFIQRWTDGNRITALVSQHGDGTLLASFLKHFRIDAIRGSTTRGGAPALRKLKDALENSHVWVTPDGPRGPRHKVKQGIIYLASQTGLPIVVNANAMSRFWDLQGNWTNQTVPKPFSRIFCLLSRPIHVPPNLSRAGIDAYQKLVEREFDRMQDLADRMASGALKELPPPPAVEAEPTVSRAA